MDATRHDLPAAMVPLLFQHERRRRDENGGGGGGLGRYGGGEGKMGGRGVTIPPETCTYLDPLSPVIGRSSGAGGGVEGGGVTGSDVESVPTVGVDPAETDGVGGLVASTSPGTNGGVGELVATSGRERDTSRSNAGIDMKVGGGVVPKRLGTGGGVAEKSTGGIVGNP